MTSKALMVFRRNFRLPYAQFLDFVREAKARKWFPERWGRPNCTGKEGSPLELLILGSLRYLGRGWTFSDCEEQTAISEEVHRVFFHDFVKVAARSFFLDPRSSRLTSTS